MKRFFYLTLLLTLTSLAPLAAQTATSEPDLIAMFPMKNLYGEVKYDSLGWTYADSLVAYLNTREGAGTAYTFIPMDDIRDQMIALNIDVRAPGYETDVWKVVKLLGAKKIIWGTYLVKYEKANVELKIIDVRTLMPDVVNIANKVRAPYPEALATVTAAGDKLLPGLKQ